MSYGPRAAHAATAVNTGGLSIDIRMGMSGWGRKCKVLRVCAAHGPSLCPWPMHAHRTLWEFGHVPCMGHGLWAVALCVLQG